MEEFGLEINGIKIHQVYLRECHSPIKLYYLEEKNVMQVHLVYIQVLNLIKLLEHLNHVMKELLL